MADIIIIVTPPHHRQVSHGVQLHAVRAIGKAARCEANSERIARLGGVPSLLELAAPLPWRSKVRDLLARSRRDPAEIPPEFVRRARHSLVG